MYFNNSRGINKKKINEEDNQYKTTLPASQLNTVNIGMSIMNWNIKMEDNKVLSLFCNSEREVLNTKSIREAK